MKSIISLLFGTLLFGFAIGQNLNEFKRQLGSKVAAPYQGALTTFAESVLGPLADSPVPDSDDKIRVLVAGLTAGVATMNQQLSSAYAGSNEAKNWLDQTIVQLVAAQSQAETNLRNTQTEINNHVAAIGATQAQINDAQNQVNAAQGALNAAEHSLRQAEDNVRKSRNCIIRRKRGWFKKITKPIRKAVKDVGKVIKKVVNGPCHIVHNIGGRKNDRNNAANHVNNMRNRLNALIAQRDALNAKRVQLEARRGQLTAHLGNVQHQLNLGRTDQRAAVSMNQNLKQVVTHLSTLFGKSTVLKETVAQLIDFETVLRPIQVISEQIMAENIPSLDVNYFSRIQSVIAQRASQLKQKLPQYPLFTFNF